MFERLVVIKHVVETFERIENEEGEGRIHKRLLGEAPPPDQQAMKDLQKKKGLLWGGGNKEGWHD